MKTYGGGHTLAAFQLDRRTTRLGHQPRPVSEGLLRPLLIRAERHVDDHQGTLQPATYCFSMHDHHVESDAERRGQAVKNHADTVAHKDYVAMPVGDFRDRRRIGGAELIASGMSRRAAAAQVASELSNLAATHRLDIRAGGDPSDISGMGNRSANSSLRSQWKGRRSQSLEDYARDMQEKGLGKEKMNVKLRRCK